LIYSSWRHSSLDLVPPSRQFPSNHTEEYMALIDYYEIQNQPRISFP
ncbi:hypothetical protein T10_2215, partial [Trichinella papuae]